LSEGVDLVDANVVTLDSWVKDDPVKWGHLEEYPWCIEYRSYGSLKQSRQTLQLTLLFFEVAAMTFLSTEAVLPFLFK